MTYSKTSTCGERITKLCLQRHALPRYFFFKSPRCSFSIALVSNFRLSFCRRVISIIIIIIAFRSGSIQPRLIYELLNARLQFRHAMIHILQSCFDRSSDTIKSSLLTV